MTTLQHLDADDLDTLDAATHPFVMAVDDTVLAAANLTDLVAALPGMEPGYAALDDDEALLARWRHAVQAAREAQDQLAHDCADFDPASHGSEQLTALFGLDKAVPLDGLHSWIEVVPLVLIATDYAPYTTAPAPAGNVLFLNPADERSLLDTLAELGLIDLAITC